MNIGVFDSGLGGLTAVKEMLKIMPYEDIVYFGDTSRVPYGTKSRETIINYTRQDINFLKTQNVKAILVACGTVSSVALSHFTENIPIIGVVEPTCTYAANVTRNGKIGVIATAKTIESDAYTKKIAQIDDKIEVISVACPLFVPFIENGRFIKGDRALEIIIEEYLTVFKQKNVDTLILGCTHYPLLLDAISDFLGNKIALINSGEHAAKQCAKALSQQNLLNAKKNIGKIKYFVSDSVQDFKKYGNMFLRQEEIHNAVQIDITQY